VRVAIVKYETPVRKRRAVSFMSLHSAHGATYACVLVSLMCIFTSGSCCSVVITQPSHLSATVSLEFSIAVAQASNLTVSIDGSKIFEDSVSGNVNFALQVLPHTLKASLCFLIFHLGAVAGHALFARGCRLRRCRRFYVFFVIPKSLPSAR
jgi:hypothetical protein